MEQENMEFLPLGSIVQLKGVVKKIMIIARGAFAVVKGEKRYFDYGACTYPEGVIGDALLYFQHKDIQKVVYRGYEDEDEKLMQENIKNNLSVLQEQLLKKEQEA